MLHHTWCHLFCHLDLPGPAFHQMNVLCCSCQDKRNHTVDFHHANANRCPCLPAATDELPNALQVMPMWRHAVDEVHNSPVSRQEPSHPAISPGIGTLLIL